MGLQMKQELLVICQKVDETDDLLGFFVAWLRQFSRHFSSVRVITLGAGVYDVPDNVSVYSLGKERGVARWRRIGMFAKLLWQYTPRHGSIFCHMSPVFAITAWPFARVRGSRLVLWYLHRAVTLRLRLAHAMCDRLVTADTTSLGISSPTIIGVGHGIDTVRFSVPGRKFSSDRPLRVLSVGRLSPIKNFETLIRAVSLARDRQVALEVRIVGRAVMPNDHQYARKLLELAARLGVSDSIHFFGFVPYRDMPAQFTWADSIVGCTPRGGLDKVLLEGMAAGCVPFTSNDVMRSTLGVDADHLLFSYGSSEDLARALEAFIPSAALSQRMVEAVRRRHDLAQTVDRITGLL
jgi:glycosyltransferase involved in cell wall biosynthesis